MLPKAPPLAPDAAAVLAALPEAMLLLDPDDTIALLNPAAEALFAQADCRPGAALGALAGIGAGLSRLVLTARLRQTRVVEHGIVWPAAKGLSERLLDAQVAPVGEDWFVLLIDDRSVARVIEPQLNQKNSARVLTGMTALLAHEIKNPLAGIRGAAQLLGNTAAADDRELSRLICREVDRIRALLDRMELLSESPPLPRGPVNIHSVLEQVRRMAEAGFGRHVRIVEHYDPSLPPVFGNHDQLVQVFQNLVKNAAESAPAEGGEIILSTGWQLGARLALSGAGGAAQALPITVSVTDNGPGIPDSIREQIFDPFVTSKQDGTGLGLAVVAKLVAEHGGLIEVDGQPRRTQFRLRLPTAPTGTMKDSIR